MTVAGRWTLAGLAVVAALVVALALQLRQPTALTGPGDVAPDPGDGGRPYLEQQSICRLGRGSHGVFDPPVRVRGIAQQRDPFGAQLHDLRDRLLRVVGVAVVAAALESPPDRFAQRAPARKRQKRIDARPRVHDRPFARQPSLFCRD